MLAHSDRELGKLLNLVARDELCADALLLGEQMPARATPRPVLDHLVNRRSRQQLATMPLMTGLRTLTATRQPALPAFVRPTRRISARRRRRVPRVTPQLTLELLNPRLQLRDPTIHRQNNLNHSLPASVIDRLSLSPIHTPKFDTGLCRPPTERLREWRDLQAEQTIWRGVMYRFTRGKSLVRSQPRP
jgi:hypothetical protein